MLFVVVCCSLFVVCRPCLRVEVVLFVGVAVWWCVLIVGVVVLLSLSVAFCSLFVVC